MTGISAVSLDGGRRAARDPWRFRCTSLPSRSRPALEVPGNTSTTKGRPRKHQDGPASWPRRRVPGGWGFLGPRFGREWGLSPPGRRPGYGSTGQQPAAIRAEHASPPKPLNSKRMTKQQLIEKVAAKTELKKSEVEAAVDSVLDLIAEALRSNERVDLRGFGSFVVKDRKERQGRNPRTGETITIAAKRDARFKPSKELTEKLAQGETAPTPEEAV